MDRQRLDKIKATMQEFLNELNQNKRMGYRVELVWEMPKLVEALEAAELENSRLQERCGILAEQLGKCQGTLYLKQKAIDSMSKIVLLPEGFPVKLQPTEYPKEADDGD